MQVIMPGFSQTLLGGRLRNGVKGITILALSATELSLEKVGVMSLKKLLFLTVFHQSFTHAPVSTTVESFNSC